eukprot:TRINITY_DN4978_c0_g2_i1.p1 TRINITY_DN4978_c0_g2~~TRINITY_DN4978_c0_g2_i1.p1  ORF type:complete len:231 (-),score=36.24 TRINITY_DN4978_c0_g2_i1:62-754(-)
MCIRDRYIYSAHDTTVINTLVSLNITGWECLLDRYSKGIYDDTKECPHAPKFASSIFIELHQDTQGWFVKFMYDDVAYKICPNGTEERCDLDEFANKVLLGDIDKDWMKTCEIVEEKPFAVGGSSWKFIVIICLAISALIMLGLIIRVVVKIKNIENAADNYGRVQVLIFVKSLFHSGGVAFCCCFRFMQSRIRFIQSVVFSAHYSFIHSFDQRKIYPCRTHNHLSLIHI